MSGSQALIAELAERVQSLEIFYREQMDRLERQESEVEENRDFSGIQNFQNEQRSELENLRCQVVELEANIESLTETIDSLSSLYRNAFRKEAGLD